jgi:hypothetical protein
VATSEPVVHHHGREGDGKKLNRLRAASFQVIAGLLDGCPQQGVVCARCEHQRFQSLKRLAGRSVGVHLVSLGVDVDLICQIGRFQGNQCVR